MTRLRMFVALFWIALGGAVPVSAQSRIAAPDIPGIGVPVVPFTGTPALQGLPTAGGLDSFRSNPLGATGLKGLPALPVRPGDSSVGSSPGTLPAGRKEPGQLPARAGHEEAAGRLESAGSQVLEVSAPIDRAASTDYDLRSSGDKIQAALEKTELSGRPASDSGDLPVWVPGGQKDPPKNLPEQTSVKKPVSTALEWDKAVIEASLILRIPVPVVRKAVQAAEKDMGTSFRSVMGAVEFKKYLISNPSFRERYLQPLLSLPSSGPGEWEWRPMVWRIAKESGVQPEQLLRWVKEAGLMSLFKDRANATRLEKELYGLAKRRQLKSMQTSWPNNAQGDFLRVMAQEILTPSGKSIEEISRSGAFAYVDFRGRIVARATAGRDPDYKGADITFYVTLEGTTWRVEYYPGGGRLSTPPLGAQESLLIFKSWMKNGIPGVRFWGEGESDGLEADATPIHGKESSGLFGRFAALPSLVPALLPA